MILNEEFWEMTRGKEKQFCAGVILPDGTFQICREGHLSKLFELMPYPKSQLWEMIPKDDSPLFWMLEKTGCIITDENATVGLAMNEAQRESYQMLVKHGIIADKYFDITRERQLRKMNEQ